MSLWMAFLLAVAAVGSTLGNVSTTNLYLLTASEFAQKAEAKQEIQLNAVQTNLMSAAVFHETNRRRAENGLPPLRHHVKALQAAAIQSRIMQKRGSISHENPENPRFETLLKRVHSVGVNPGLAAENVATAFGLRYESGKAFYKRESGGKTVYSYRPEGGVIPPHTYESFARALVESWMNSAGHRKNILLKEAEYLGVSCMGAAAESGMPVFYCTQVFLAPLRVSRQ